MSAVMIGIDPHKGSHTAVAIGAAEEPLGELRVRASAAQAGTLVAWAAPWPKRTWAVEGAGGLGHLLAQQLVAAGERVLDVPPKLASRVRLLQAGDTNKNDPNDALSVAVAALRSKARRQVLAEDHAAVLKVWAKRHRDLARSRNQVACRLHSVLCELRAGGVSKEITAAHAPASWSRSRRPARSGSHATSWPASSCRTCEAWMPSSVTPRRSWPRPSGPRAPASPRSSASARPAPAP
jgi:transposase